MVAGEHMLGERPGRYEFCAVSAIVIGVIGAGVFAPRTTTHVSAPGTTTLILIGLGLLALFPYLLRAFRRPLAGLTIFCAGCAFAWSAIATKLAANDLKVGHVPIGLIWGLSTAAASGVGTLSEMSSLQSRPAIQVAPVVFVTQTVLPVGVAPLLFGEHFDATPLDGWPLMASLALLVAGASLLARSPLLLAMMEGQPASEASGETPSPSAESLETTRSSPSSEPDDPSSSTTTTSPARSGR
jgi:hypothetical protein